MTRLTLFSAPKPFSDPRIAAIQTNALESWARLSDVDVLLLGQGEGISEAARAYGAVHLPDVRTNGSGTPLVSSMIELARQHGRGKLLGIINADMIAMNDLVDAAKQVEPRLPEFVLLGRRWDLDVAGMQDFASDWEARLREQARQEGKLHKPAGSDFFIFPPQMYTEVPDFAVGRAGWDNWMIFSARRRGVPVIDCTESCMLVHQNHDYAHLPGGRPHYALPETDENIRLAGGVAAIRYTVMDATYLLRDGQLARPPISRARIARGIELLLRRALFFLPPGRVESIARPKRWRQRWHRLTGGVRRQAESPDGDKPSHSRKKNA